MTDQPSPAKLGLTDEELAAHPTMFAADALKDQVVVVSGGAGGIGRAIAWLFARLGAHVAVVGRDGGKLDALVANWPAAASRPPRIPPTSGSPTRSTPCSIRSGPRMAASTASSTAPAGSFRKPRSIFR